MNPPYRAGDLVSVLHYANGTCLATSTIHGITPHIGGGWAIIYDNPANRDELITCIVNDRGRDKHGYVCRKITS